MLFKTAPEREENTFANSFLKGKEGNPEPAVWLRGDHSKMKCSVRHKNHRGKGLAVVILAILLAVLFTACGDDELTPTGENKKGLTDYEAGNYESAKTHFERAVSLDSSAKEYHNNLGMTLIQLEEYSEAISQFTMVITDNPTSTDEKKLVKFAYRGKGLAFLQRQDFSEALQAFNSALAVDVMEDWDIDILYYKANVLECMGYPTSAIENYNAVLEMDSDNQPALLARANLYREDGDYTNAEKDYQAVLTNSEGTYEAYIGLYVCYIETDRNDEATALLDEATRLTVKDDEDKYRLGQVHFYQGNYDSAEIEMENAVANGYTEAYYFLGEIALSKEDYETALGYYEQYRETHVVESPSVCNQEAVCYLALYDYDKAEELINLGLAYEGSPAYQKLLRNRVALYEGRTEYKKAYEALQDYIVSFPDDTDATDEYRFLKKLLGTDQEEEEE